MIIIHILYNVTLNKIGFITGGNGKGTSCQTAEDAELFFF